MWAVINSIQIILMVIWTFICVTCVVLLPVKIQYWVCNNIWAPGIFLIFGIRLKTTGREHLKETENYIVVGNHTSWGDIIVLFISINNLLRFIAKIELAKLPLIGIMMKRMGMVFVERGNSQKSAKSVKQTLEKIKGGAKMVGFPEGTRSKTGKIGQFKKGLIMIAVKAEIDIIPVGLVNVYNVWPRNNFSFRPGKVKANIGKPISTKGYDESNINELVEKVKAQVTLLSEQGE